MSQFFLVLESDKFLWCLQVILYSHPKQRFHHWPAMWTGEQLALYRKKNFSVYFLQVLLRVSCEFVYETHGRVEEEVEEEKEEELPIPPKRLCYEQWKHSSIYLRCQALKDPNYKLKELQLWRCQLTATCCGDLATVLRVKHNLTELELGGNYLGDAGVRELRRGLNHSNCKLQRLGLRYCHLTHSICGDLNAVLSISLSLCELDLGRNKDLGDVGVQLLCEGLQYPNCKLQKLGLEHCGLTAGCCRELSSVLRTSQTLTELGLGRNDFHDSGVQLLCQGLKHPSCKLQKIQLNIFDK
ncbi:NACHT, LRR and PYD domains-containing protein 3-like [Alligator sinensis]|uniref:NACHT, LRR and PYD domains-containing protein 3-like n=1 Tax=Alligator sinensis TaxID=38654 RepID=A0A3Q0HG15_ALLSI|nr:NACHT, LRR and PYD domains-containing protein 3-like [Alligator sinensis]